VSFDFDVLLRLLLNKHFKIKKKNRIQHVMMPGSDSEDSCFGDDLALPITQAARISSAGPARSKKTQTKGAIW